MKEVLKENLKAGAAVISGLTGFYLGWTYGLQIYHWLLTEVLK